MHLLALCVLLILSSLPAFANLLASPSTPYSLGGTVTTVDLTGVALGHNPDVVGTGWAIDFTPNASSDPDWGVVVGAKTGKYAIPYAGPGQPWSGQYLSVAPNTSITINFTDPQAGLAFLWGSVDTYNSMTVSFSNGQTYTGAQAAAAAGINANGFQGYGGSAWIAINPDPGNTTFQSVTFTSTQYAFEIAGVQASTGGYGVPDGGMTLMLLGGALVGLETLRRKFRS